MSAHISGNILISWNGDYEIYSGCVGRVWRGISLWQIFDKTPEKPNANQGLSILSCYFVYFNEMKLFLNNFFPQCNVITKRWKNITTNLANVAKYNPETWIFHISTD